MKITKINGFNYSKQEFKDYKIRCIFRLSQSNDWREDTVVTIYTNCLDKEQVHNAIVSKTTDKCIKCEMEHWTTKEQDDLSSKFLDDILENI